MAISLRLTPEETALFKNYAAFYGISLSELVRRSVLEKIENEYDLKVFEKAYAEYEKDPVTYSIDEVKEELGLL